MLLRTNQINLSSKSPISFSDHKFHPFQKKSLSSLEMKVLKEKIKILEFAGKFISSKNVKRSQWIKEFLLKFQARQSAQNFNLDFNFGPMRIHCLNNNFLM